MMSRLDKKQHNKNVPLQAGMTNLAQNNFREISSWLETTRSGNAKKERTETKQKPIIVVDDKSMRQFYTSIFLQQLKYHVITAKTAEEALLFLAISVPLAIIANVDLPQMNGVDFLKKVKQNHRTWDIPFIIYTSNKDPQVKQRCKEAGCAAYLSHPSSLNELYVAIQKATEKKPRRFVRLTTYLDVIVGDSLRSDTNGTCDYITAISEKGMFVKTNCPLSNGSVHPFTFSLPTDSGRIFRLEGQVLYCHINSDSKKLLGIGVKFLKIGATDQRLIRDFIKKNFLEGITIQ